MMKRLVEFGDTLIRLLAFVMILGAGIAITVAVYKYAIIPLFK